MTDKEKEEIAMVVHAVDRLGEHFDTVQIFVTRHDGMSTGTTNLNRGAGNWYARYGQVVEWINKESEVSRIDVRSSHKPKE